MRQTRQARHTSPVPLRAAKAVLRDRFEHAINAWPPESLREDTKLEDIVRLKKYRLGLHALVLNWLRQARNRAHMGYQRPHPLTPDQSIVRRAENCRMLPPWP